MFRLSTKTRYGTRAITYIAAYGKGRPISINEISEKERISLKYLERIMSSLKSSGLVSSIQGAYGGYTFTGNTEEVTLSDIIIALEGPVNLTECLKDSVECEMEESCGIIDVWNDINQTINKKLISITLKDLVDSRIRKMEQRNPIYYI